MPTLFRLLAVAAALFAARLVALPVAPHLCPLLPLHLRLIAPA